MAKYLYINGMGVPLVDPESGAADYYPEEQARELIGQGWTPTTPQQVTKIGTERAYADIPGSAFLKGAARGVTFGLSDLAATATSDPRAEESLRLLQEQNPMASVAGELTGAIGSALIPGTPVALLGKAGQAVGAGVRGALGGGKAAALTGQVARGVAEGAGFGVGTGVSEIALDDKPATMDSVAETLTRHIKTGALFGGGLALGTAGVVAGGKWAAEKVGLSKGARGLLEQQATLTREVQAITENKRALVADLEKKLYTPAERAEVERQIAGLEAEVSARVKSMEWLDEAVPIELKSADDRYAMAKDLQARLKAQKAASAEAQSLYEQRAADLEALKARAGRQAEEVVEAPRAAPAPEANPALSEAQAKVDGLRAKFGESAPPPLEQRWQAVLEETRGRNPMAVDRAAAKKDIAGQINSLYGNAFHAAVPEGSGKEALAAAQKAAKSWANEKRWDALEKMEKALGLGSWGQAGKDLAAAESRLMRVAKKAPEAAPSTEATRAVKTALQEDFAGLIEQAQQAKQEAFAGVKQEKANWAKLRDLYGLEPKHEKGLDRLISRWETSSGHEARLSQARAQLDDQAALDKKIEATLEGTAEERAKIAELDEVATKLGEGKGGILGRLAKATAKRSLEWGGMRTVAKGLGSSGGMRGARGWRDILANSAGLEVARAASPKLLRALEALVSPGNVSAAAKGTGWLGGKVAGAGKAAGRVARPGIQMEGAKVFSEQDFKDAENDLSIPIEAYDTVTRSALRGQPEELVNAVVEAHVRQRLFLESKMPRDPLAPALPPGVPAIPTRRGKWTPPLEERVKFGRYVRAASHWKNTIEDLVSGQATVEHMEALQAVYPDVYTALKTYVTNGVRTAAAKGLSYGEQEARMIDLVLGPPYQMLANAHIYQMTYRPTQRQQPSKGMGAKAITLSKAMMPQLQAAQTGGLTR